QAETDEPSEEKVTSMSLDILKEYKFNLESSIGTMIHSKRRFDFNFLDGIVHAFGETFCVRDNKGNRSGKLPEVKTWFSGKDHEKLRILKAVRHLLAHKAGQIDRPFLVRLSQIIAED